MKKIIIAFVLMLQAANAQHQQATGDFTMALTGDSIITRPLSPYTEPEFLEMIELIRNSDMAFTNLEMLFHDYEPYPMAVSGGTYMRGDPKLAQELKWAGFDMVSRANNHTGDYGVLGQTLTTKYVNEVGIIQAGVGMSLAEAREAKFLETGKARVALISVASTFATHMAAGRSRDNAPPRPGLNPLRYSRTYILPEEEWNNLRKTGESLGLFTNQDGEPRGTSEDRPDAFNLYGRWFEKSDTNIISRWIGEGEVAGVRTEPNKKDMKEIVAVISNAKKLADYVIVTIHAHEQKGPREIPADFIGEFAKATIDAGADVFVGHGPHVLRGIEMYKGKPIMYSLGDFMFQNETLLRLPADNYDNYDLDDNAHVADFNNKRYKGGTSGFPALDEIWEGALAIPTFNGQTVKELAIYPVTLGYGLPEQVRGRPLLAKGELADKILNDLKTRSNPYGTEITIRDGVGYVEIE
ncbi:MAG: CapA family protein [Kordiimonadaceae bacterium]|jgi:poly-gamma-glutamate capsule biosynthesis protein CapA/YwtB (metallophosphatase superfamily)|nr:CapA family protein [Kordiimonadaceae bacterium]MBT6037020.1 CapA family protein [Kordiimonadaceae bacterium]MBT6328627.1 CapA family protein [Kordiimonadaceae bacterium]